MKTLELDPTQPPIRLVAAVRAALKNGVQHRTTMGMPLETAVEVLSALTQFGEIDLDYTRHDPVTTPAAELAVLADLISAASSAASERSA